MPRFHGPKAPTVIHQECGNDVHGDSGRAVPEAARAGTALPGCAFLSPGKGQDPHPQRWTSNHSPFRVLDFQEARLLGGMCVSLGGGATGSG